jgi:hypothetical protein
VPLGRNKQPSFRDLIPVKTSPLLALGATLCLALTSCVPKSGSPLSPSETAHPDQHLVGDWLEKNDQETYRITLKEGPWMHVDIITKSGEKSDSYDFYLTQSAKILSQTLSSPIRTNKETTLGPIPSSVIPSLKTASSKCGSCHPT